MIGICGDDCLQCPRYIATKKGDTGALRAVKDWWVRLGLRQPDFPAQDMACSGCGQETKCAYPEIQACAHGKGMGHCGLCRGYPCPLLRAVFEKSDQLRSHAARICTTEEMETLDRAFFSKRQNLDRTRTA